MLKKNEEVKTLILVIMEHLGEPQEPGDVISAVCGTDMADINDVSDAFEEMTGGGLIKVFKDGEKELCALSENALHILPELRSLLSRGTAEEAIRKADRFFNAEKSGTQYYSKIEKADGKFTLCIGEISDGTERCKVCTVFDDEKQAVLAKKRFDENEGHIIGTIKALVTGNADYIP